MENGAGDVFFRLICILRTEKQREDKPQSATCRHPFICRNKSEAWADGHRNHSPPPRRRRRRLPGETFHWSRSTPKPSKSRRWKDLKKITSALSFQRPLWMGVGGGTLEVHTKFEAEADFRAVIHKRRGKIFFFSFFSFFFSEETWWGLENRSRSSVSAGPLASAVSLVSWQPGGGLGLGERGALKQFDYRRVITFFSPSQFLLFFFPSPPSCVCCSTGRNAALASESPIGGTEDEVAPPRRRVLIDCGRVTE